MWLEEDPNPHFGLQHSKLTALNETSQEFIVVYFVLIEFDFPMWIDLFTVYEHIELPELQIKLILPS